VLRNLFGIPLLCAALVVELAIIALLLNASEYLANLASGITQEQLLGIHAVASLLAAVCISTLLHNLYPGRRGSFIAFLFLMSLFVPFIGAAGSWFALTFGALMARNRHYVNEFWQFTNNADLPFAAPIDRAHPKLDSRGFVEQLMFDNDTEALYNKVVASRHIRDSQSAPILKSAVGHSNERIRLVAYQMLDKKTTKLNREIQRLESKLEEGAVQSKSNMYLQVANNYWELLTLEGDEPVAREQMLNKASQHLYSAIEIQPNNINAQFLLGQVSMKQGDYRAADAAFDAANRLGMSMDKLIPYMAETAFIERDFKKMRQILAKLDPAFRAYPPLSQVVEFWA